MVQAVDDTSRGSFGLCSYTRSYGCRDYPLLSRELVHAFQPHDMATVAREALEAAGKLCQR